MRLVAIECPLNRAAYAAACWRDCISRGESPLTPLPILRTTLKALEPHDLEQAIAAHAEWVDRAHVVVLYADYTIDPPMRTMAKRAVALGRVVEIRTLTPGMDTTHVVDDIFGRDQVV